MRKFVDVLLIYGFGLARVEVWSEEAICRTRIPKTYSCKISMGSNGSMLRW